MVFMMLKMFNKFNTNKIFFFSYKLKYNYTKINFNNDNNNLLLFSKFFKNHNNKLSNIFKSDTSHVELHRFVHYANLISRSSCTVYLSFSILGLLNLFVAKLHLSTRLFTSLFFNKFFILKNNIDNIPSNSESKDNIMDSLLVSDLFNNDLIYYGLYNTPNSFYILFFLFSLLILFYADAWIEEIYMESTLFGKYTAKVRATLVYGFFIFLLSELMVFFGLFWSLYELIGMGQEEIGSIWFTLAISDYAQLFLDPLLGTITLFTSGYFVNYAFVKNRIRENISSRFFLLIGIILGIFFLTIQGSEYTNLADSCSLKAVWSVFYLITGFHGFHVFVGLTFLFQVYMQLLNYDLPGDKMISFFLAISYWHFVDWVWILVLYRLYDIVNYSFIDLLVF